ncbi:unnamed protein product [Parnassius apollo]|uniref:(apollo) hypothetical protein n=1 Tax=Parnassius apollo TaxID=110799 RepID=A0A8S3Y2M2_PARAO|nr:unnamed protein product [Parnassius apollo]
MSAFTEYSRQQSRFFYLLAATVPIRSSAPLQQALYIDLRLGSDQPNLKRCRAFFLQAPKRHKRKRRSGPFCGAKRKMAFRHLSHSKHQKEWSSGVVFLNTRSNVVLGRFLSKR